MKTILILSLFFLTGCSLFCKSIPNLPEHTLTVKTVVQGECLGEGFSITKDFIGFNGDIGHLPYEECRQISGLSLGDWEELEAYLKAVFDTHEIPKDKLNLHNGALDFTGRRR